MDRVVIEFKAQINAVTTSSNTASSSASRSAGLGFSYGGYVNYNFQASHSAQKTLSDTSSTSESYSLTMTVEAAQDEVPSGMRTMLDLLEDAIRMGVKS